MAHSGSALITGASSGIGECFARALAVRKRNLVLVARSQAKLETLASALRAAHGIQADPLPADLSTAAGVLGLMNGLRERGLEIDLLVNNAGFGARGRFWELPLERQTEMIGLNVQAVIELTHRLLPGMIARRRGGIINVSSTASFQPVPFTTVYGATKAFVTSFSIALAEELRGYGITVVTLCPGGTDTNFFEAGQYGLRRVPFDLQPPDEVVEAALRAFDRGGGLVVPRLINKVGVFSQRLVPRSLAVKVAARLFRV